MIRVSFRLAVAATAALFFSAWGAEEAPIRFFEPEPGFTQAKNISDTLRGKVDSISFSINDAFDGAVTHSDAERTLYEFGNKLHIKSLESTIRQRLLFKKGDSVTADLLRENEKYLRNEFFLADAVIEVKQKPDSTLAVKVTTYDQWTTTPAFGLNRKGGKWIWWLGPVESNLLGTGQQVGFLVGHDVQERDTRLLTYTNNSFSPYQLQLTGQYLWLSDPNSTTDGHSYSVGVTRPLLMRTDRWGFTVTASSVESAEYYYLSGNDLDQWERKGWLDSSAQQGFGQTNLLWERTRVATHDSYASVTRSFGYTLKTSIAPFYEHEARYNMADSLVNSVFVPALDSAGQNAMPGLDSRRDEILGVSFGLYEYENKTVHNFRNLKWSENLVTGWRLTAGVGQNQTWLGARNSDLLFSYAAVYNNAWLDRFFVSTSATLRYFLSPDSGLDNGSTSVHGDVQWKPLPALSTVLSGQYDNLFAAAAGQRLYLGGESGLNGFPNYYYGGKARVFFSAEERYFPPLEFGTLVPAFAVFLNAGNTYSTNDAVDLHELHYSTGVGLRLGQSRSVQKIINHLDVSWPLGESNLGPWSFFKYFSIVASKNL